MSWIFSEIHFHSLLACLLQFFSVQQEFDFFDEIIHTFWSSYMVISNKNSCLDFHVQDVSRLVKQVDKYAQLSDMLQQHMRCMQSFQYKHYIDAYYALEKSAKYPLL